MESTKITGRDWFVISEFIKRNKLIIVSLKKKYPYYVVRVIDWA